MRPEEVAGEARRRAEARGAGSEPAGGPPAEDLRESLWRWAFIEVDPSDLLRSTRALGAPITGAKRMIGRLLGQYHTEQNAQITRFNTGVLSHLERLERRVAELEEEVRRRGGDPGSGDAPPGGR